MLAIVSVRILVVLAAKFFQRCTEIAPIVDEADGGFTGAGGNGGVDEDTNRRIGGHAGRRGCQGSPKGSVPTFIFYLCYFGLWRVVGSTKNSINVIISIQH